MIAELAVAFLIGGIVGAFLVWKCRPTPEACRFEKCKPIIQKVRIPGPPVVKEPADPNPMRLPEPKKSDTYKVDL